MKSETKSRDESLPRVRHLDEIRPLEIAMAAERELQKERERIDELLGSTNKLDDAGQPMTLLATRVFKIVAYAHGDDVKDARGAAHAARELLAEAVSTRVYKVKPDDPSLERVDPYLSEISVACCAALGRYRIEVEKGDVPDAWLAALLSVNVASVRTYICLPNKPGVFLERPKSGPKAARKRLIKRESALALLERRGLALSA